MLCCSLNSQPYSHLCLMRGAASMANKVSWKIAKTPGATLCHANHDPALTGFKSRVQPPHAPVTGFLSAYPPNFALWTSIIPSGGSFLLLCALLVFTLNIWFSLALLFLFLRFRVHTSFTWVRLGPRSFGPLFLFDVIDVTTHSRHTHLSAPARLTASSRPI